MASQPNLGKEPTIFCNNSRLWHVRYGKLESDKFIEIPINQDRVNLSEIEIARI